MPAATMQRSQHLVELEKGLRTLKASKLRDRHEFETMYGVIEQHHRDLKLGYLTGMPSDRRKQAEQDCKFYFILAKMMGEIDCGGEAERQVGLAQVYNWFEQHRETLNTGPRFGRAKRKSAKSTEGSVRPSTAGGSSTTSSKVAGNRSLRPASSVSQERTILCNTESADIVIKVSSAKSRRTNTPVRQPSPEQLPHQRTPEVQHPLSPPASEVSAAAEYYFRQYGGGHIEDVGLTSEGQPPVTSGPVISDSATSVVTRPHSAPIQHECRPQAPTPDLAMRGRRPNTAASESVLLPRRKPLPLPHVFNPLSKAFEATVEALPGSGPPTDRSTGSNPARFQLSSRDNIPRGQTAKNTKEETQSNDGGRVYEDATGGSVYQDSAGGVISLRMSHLQKWGNYQQTQNMGQDMLAKLQHVGRAGVPGSTRYAAHEHGLTTEDMTQHVIANYAVLDEYRKGQNGTTPVADSRPLNERPLEEFYESTEPYYPVKRNKYPSFRGKSAPPGGKGARSGGNKENVAYGSGGSQEEENASNIRLDALVNMIDTVTDEMTTHKEKVAPEPLPGFRQPTLPVDPGSRPQTAPPGARARPSSPDNRDARSESHMYNQVAPGREQLLLRPATEGATGRAASERKDSPLTPFELLDWRGKVTPDTARSKGFQSFGSHSFVQKMSRPRSSLRSATSGASNPSWRPKTSSTVTTMEEQYPQEMYTVAESKRPPVAASHTTTEVDADVVSALLTTTKFNSGTMRTRPQIQDPDEEDLFLSLRELGRRSTSDYQQSNPPPNMEYMTFCTSMKSIQGTKPEKHERQSQQYSQIQSQDMYTSTSQGQVTAPPPASIPVLTDTSKFLEEVQRMVESGALEVEDGDEGPQNTARSEAKEAEIMDAVTNLEENVEEASPCTEPGKKRLTFLLEEDRPPVAPGGEQDGRGLVTDGVPASTTEFGLSEDESAIMNVDIDQYVKTLAPTSRGATTASERLSAGYKHRVFQHAFPTTPRTASGAGPDEDEQIADNTDDGLTIQGCGARTADKRKSRPGSAGAADSTEVKKTSSGMKGRRTVGTVPARAKSANPLRVLQKQSEMLKKSPVEPYRTPPSIPTPWGQFGTRTQKTPMPPPPPPPPAAPVYMAELEAHSRKVSSPRHYMEKATYKFDVARGMLITDLRRPPAEKEDPVPRLPPPEQMSEQERQLVEPLKVFRMRHEDGTPIIISCEARPDRAHSSHTHHTGHGEDDGSGQEGPCEACAQENRQQGEYMGQRLLNMGRPIPQYLPAADPVEVAAAAQRLKEAQAAVDIQRIFRGYVARNNYKYLKTEERQRREDQQKAAIEIQRHMRGHLSRKRAIYNRKPDVETLAWAKEYSAHLKDRERVRKVKALEEHERLGKKNAEKAAKLAIIGPHVDVYEPFHPKRTGPDRALLNRAATIMQKVARGWLVRKRLERLKRKAKYHASSWSKFMTHYRELLRRVQLRAGMDKPRTPFDFSDISEYMDLKKRYESVFDKRAFGGEMEHEELPAYFKECELYPAKSEIEDACSSIFRGQVLKKPRGMYKQEVLEVTFQIYPPKGTGIQSTRKSTWLNPIVDGEEAIKLSGTDNVEPTDFKTCWKLVSGTAKERREQIAAAKREADQEEERQEEEARKALKAAKRRQAEQKPSGEEENEGSKTVGTSDDTSAAPEVTSAPEAEVAVSGLNVSAVQGEETETREGEVLPLSEKTFIEEKLERIEKEAPAWNPPSPTSLDLPPLEETAEVPPGSGDSAVDGVLGTIAEGAEAEGQPDTAGDEGQSGDKA